MPTADVHPREQALIAPGNVLALGAAVAPPLTVVAPLGVAPLLAVLAAALLVSDRRACLAALRRFAPLAALLTALSLWAAITAAWSPIPGHSLLEAMRFLVIAGAGIFVLGAAAALSSTEAERLGAAVLVGVAAAVVLLEIERWSGGIIVRALHQRRLDPAMIIYRYDRGVTFLALAAWPAAAALTARRRVWTMLAGALVIALTLALFRSTSALIAGGLGVLAALLARLAPRLAATLMAAAALLLVAIFPFVAPGGGTIEHIRETAPLLKESAIHRLIIWRFVSDRIAERPFLGWGMDASRAIPGGEAKTSDVMPEVKLEGIHTMLPLHPHDAALQWRLELGWPGALLCLGILALVLWRIAGDPRLAPAQRALALGCAAAVLTIAMLSFGAWQAWWLCAIWLVAALLAGVQPRPVS